MRIPKTNKIKNKCNPLLTVTIFVWWFYFIIISSTRKKSTLKIIHKPQCIQSHINILCLSSIKCKRRIVFHCLANKIFYSMAKYFDYCWENINQYFVYAKVGGSRFHKRGFHRQCTINILHQIEIDSMQTMLI